MFKHNLILIYRNLKRSKTTFFINLIGLSCGIACVSMIYLWVNDELSFDKYHEQDSRLYQVMHNDKSDQGVETSKNTPNSLSESLALELPEVEQATVVTPEGFFPEFTLSANDKHVKGAGKFAGKDFFRIFTYKLILGDQSNVLKDKNAIVLSESQAKKLFRSTENIIGQTITWDMGGMKKECVVTGVFNDVPINSSESFDFILSFDDFKEIMGMGPNWNSEPFITYVTVKEGTDINHFNNKLTTFIQSKSDDRTRGFFLKPFSENYLYSKYENGKEAGGRIDYVNLFSLIGLFILVISCINFMNLSTAKASKRAKEVGIKKVIGVGRKGLIIQYLGESLLLSFLSLIVAVIIVLVLLPQFNEVTGKSLRFHFNLPICLALLGITIITGFLSGSYPALYLSAFKPVEVLNNRIRTSIAELWTRKGLVVFQFSMSIIFIVSVIILYKQIDYVQHKNLGFNKDNIIYFKTDGSNTDAYVNEIQKLAGVEMVSSMIGSLIINDFKGQGTIEWNGKKISTQAFGINYGAIETLGMEIKEGRSFSRDFGSTNSQIIVNEAAVRAMGLKNAVGTIIKGQANNREIIGVVKDFHFQSLHEKIEPITFRLDSYGASTILAKIKEGREKEVISGLEGLSKKLNPGLPFDYKFLDQDYQALYTSEKQVSTLSRYFASLAIVISCLGLFGLAAFTAEKRLKEIGIRKVLGSSAFGIVRLLSADFTKMVFIAICIALPLSYLIARNWLDNFAFSINLEWWYFVGAALLTVIIALLTVSLQSINAATTNPIKGLRAE